MNGNRWLGVIGAAMVIVGAACAAPTPDPSTPGTTGPRPGASRTAATTSAASSASASPSPSVRPGLGAELDVVTLGVEGSRGIDVFASTGNAIIFSASFLPDAARNVAPDLWRIRPDVGPEPELVWKNPARDHALVSLTGDLDTYAFVDMPTDGSRAWDLWLLPRDGEPLLLDSHPGDEDVSSLVPSVAIYEPIVVWTAFDRGPAGPVSQLLAASAPDWQPRVIAERLASEAELWSPSLVGSTLAFTEVVYAPDRSTDERFVHLGSIDSLAAARRLDASGQATMPILTDDAVLWKEPDPGFSMFNWGRMWRHDLADGSTTPLDTFPSEYVNYPSGDGRWLTWWGAESDTLAVYDLGHDEPRVVERYAGDGAELVMRPHVAGDLLVWLFVSHDDAGDAVGELRYAWLPGWLEFRQEGRGG